MTREANEAALKFAKKLKGDSSKQKMIAFKSGFHGRSMGSLSLTHKPAIRTPYEPLLPNVQVRNVAFTSSVYFC